MGRGCLIWVYSLHPKIGLVLVEALSVTRFTTYSCSSSSRMVTIISPVAVCCKKPRGAAWGVVASGLSDEYYSHNGA